MERDYVARFGVPLGTASVKKLLQYFTLHSPKLPTD